MRIVLKKQFLINDNNKYKNNLCKLPHQDTEYIDHKFRVKTSTMIFDSLRN
jgi:hypothetical protein